MGSTISALSVRVNNHHSLPVVTAYIGVYLEVGQQDLREQSLSLLLLSQLLSLFLSNHPNNRNRAFIAKSPSIYVSPFISTKHSKGIKMGKIPGSAHVNLSFGGLVMLGGAYGYLKKGSKASLAAGMTVGSILIGSGYLIAFSDDQQYTGHVTAAVSSGVLAAAMGKRFLSTSKFMPAGLVATLGVAACAYNVQKAKEWA